MTVNGSLKNGATAPQKVQFGKEAKKEFLLDPTWTNLNHGSFGGIPKAIQEKQRSYQAQAEARPDQYIRRTYPALLRESRAAVAKLINAPVDEVVFVGNATVAANTIFKGMTWNEDGKDTILSFNTIYGACGKVEDYVVDTSKGKVARKEIHLVYPLEDDEIVQIFRDAVKQIEAEGKRARICLFDVVSSSPGVCFPWIQMVKACKELNVLSLVDGAQGVGMVPLDLSAVDPDFFFSNCHKWLYVPRGCAVFYVPKRNQGLLATTLTTSGRYVSASNPLKLPSPHVDTDEPHFVQSHSFVGTLDDAPYCCVKDAIKWREETFGSEEAIIAYNNDLNRKGCEHVASYIGGELIENKAKTLMASAIGTIFLPIWIGERKGGSETDVVVPQEDLWPIYNWLEEVQMEEYKTFMAVSVRWGRFVIRLSAQVYLDMDDYEWAAKTLQELIERVRKGEYKK